MTLVFASNNRHKLREIREILNNEVEILSLEDIGCREEIPEEHDTLEGNACQKAGYIFQRYTMNCFADDTGLEIEALKGEPGVYSARYAGENCTFDDNMNLVLEKMKGIRNRKARFRTVIALIENGILSTFEGSVEGSIISEKKGLAGFGYDPIFIPDGFKETFAEMPHIIKNTVSHRARAIASFIAHIKTQT